MHESFEINSLGISSQLVDVLGTTVSNMTCFFRCYFGNWSHQLAIFIFLLFSQNKESVGTQVNLQYLHGVWDIICLVVDVIDESMGENVSAVPLSVR